MLRWSLMALEGKTAVIAYDRPLGLYGSSRVALIEQALAVSDDIVSAKIRTLEAEWIRQQESQLKDSIEALVLQNLNTLLRSRLRDGMIVLEPFSGSRQNETKFLVAKQNFAADGLASTLAYVASDNSGVGGAAVSAPMALNLPSAEVYELVAAPPSSRGSLPKLAESETIETLLNYNPNRFSKESAFMTSRMRSFVRPGMSSIGALLASSRAKRSMESGQIDTPRPWEKDVSIKSTRAMFTELERVVRSTAAALVYDEVQLPDSVVVCPYPYDEVYFAERVATGIDVQVCYLYVGNGSSANVGDFSKLPPESAPLVGTMICVWQRGDVWYARDAANQQAATPCLTSTLDSLSAFAEFGSLYVARSPGKTVWGTHRYTRTGGRTPDCEMFSCPVSDNVIIRRTTTKFSPPVIEISGESGVLKDHMVLFSGLDKYAGAERELMSSMPFSAARRDVQTFVDLVWREFSTKGIPEIGYMLTMAEETPAIMPTDILYVETSAASFLGDGGGDGAKGSWYVGNFPVVASNAFINATAFILDTHEP